MVLSEKTNREDCLSHLGKPNTPFKGRGALLQDEMAVVKPLNARRAAQELSSASHYVMQLAPLVAPASKASSSVRTPHRVGSSKLVRAILLMLLLLLAASFGVLLAALLSMQEPVQLDSPQMVIEESCEINYSDALAPRAPAMPAPRCGWAWQGWKGPRCGPSYFCRIGIKWRLSLPTPTCRPR
jgi:hypothetical protein